MGTVTSLEDFKRDKALAVLNADPRVQRLNSRIARFQSLLDNNEYKTQVERADIEAYIASLKTTITDHEEEMYGTRYSA